MNSPVPASFHAAMIFVFAALLVGTPDSGRADETAAAEDQYIWDLTDFYPSKAAWTTELERLRGEVNFLAPYVSKLGAGGELMMRGPGGERAYAAMDLI